MYLNQSTLHSSMMDRNCPVIVSHSSSSIFQKLFLLITPDELAKISILFYLNMSETSFTLSYNILVFLTSRIIPLAQSSPTFSLTIVSLIFLYLR